MIRLSANGDVILSKADKKKEGKRNARNATSINETGFVIAIKSRASSKWPRSLVHSRHCHSTKTTNHKKLEHCKQIIKREWVTQKSEDLFCVRHKTEREREREREKVLNEKNERTLNVLRRCQIVCHIQVLCSWCSAALGSSYITQKLYFIQKQVKHTHTLDESYPFQVFWHFLFVLGCECCASTPWKWLFFLSSVNGNERESCRF